MLQLVEWIDSREPVVLLAGITHTPSLISIAALGEYGEEKAFVSLQCIAWRYHVAVGLAPSVITGLASRCERPSDMGGRLLPRCHEHLIDDQQH